MASEDADWLTGLGRGRRETIATFVVALGSVGEGLECLTWDLIAVRHENSVSAADICHNPASSVGTVDDAITESEPGTDPPAVMNVSIFRLRWD